MRFFSSFSTFLTQNVDRAYIGIFYLINVECCNYTVYFGIKLYVLTWGLHFNSDDIFFFTPKG